MQVLDWRPASRYTLLMPRPRKTIGLLDFINTMNARIARCPDLEGRKALCLALEAFLHEANAYAGFSYKRADGTYASPEEVQAPEWTDEWRHSYGCKVA